MILPIRHLHIYMSFKTRAAGRTVSEYGAAVARNADMGMTPYIAADD